MLQKIKNVLTFSLDSGWFSRDCNLKEPLFTDFFTAGNSFAICLAAALKINSGWQCGLQNLSQRMQVVIGYPAKKNQFGISPEWFLIQYFQQIF